MMSQATTEVVTGKSSVKREFLSVGVRRTRRGVELRIKGAPELEAYFCNAATPEGATEPSTAASSYEPWSRYRFYRSGLSERIVSPEGHQGILDKVGSTQLGNPGVDGYGATYNVSWVRAVGLSSAEGVTLEFPHVWTADMAKQYTSAVVCLFKQFYKDRLQPYDIAVSITVNELIDATP